MQFSKIYEQAYKFSQKILDRAVEGLHILTAILVFISIFAILTIIYQGFLLPIDLSPKGVQNWLKLFEPFAILFSSTLALILGTEAFKRLKLMEESNSNAFRASNRTIWIQTVKDFYSVEIKSDDPGVIIIINKNLWNIHDFLFKRNYTIENQAQTQEFFEEFFRKDVGYMEGQNKEFQRIACYPDKDYSFSWDNFRYLVSIMLGDKVYPEFEHDLRSFYQSEIINHIQSGSHVVDYELYRKNKNRIIPFV